MHGPEGEDGLYVRISLYKGDLAVAGPRPMLDRVDVRRVLGSLQLG